MGPEDGTVAFHTVILLTSVSKKSLLDVLVSKEIDKKNDRSSLCVNEKRGAKKDEERFWRCEKSLQTLHLIFQKKKSQVSKTDKSF